MDRRFCLSALVALAVAAVSIPAHAQQAAAYQTKFDDADGWEFTEYYGVQWGVDASPIEGYSASNSLNYNNGSDYDTGDFVYGLAFSPEIALSNYPSATLTFRCRYQTEDPSQNPGREADYRFLMVMDATGEILTSDQFSAQTCGAMDAWHEHEVDLSPAWGAVRFIFYFDSGDEFANNYQGWFIDDFVIGVPDVTPPAPVTNLAAGSPTTVTMLLTWTAPTDDDTSGAAASYDLRLSTGPITAANFAGATEVTGEPVPGAGGTPHQVTVSGLSPSTTYYFALRTTDKSGNVSAISNVASAATLAVPVPPQVTSGGAPTEEKDRIAACGAAASAGPVGVLLVGLLILAARAGRAS